MSEALAVLHRHNRIGIGGKPNIGRELKGFAGDTSRKKLADISNMPCQDRYLTHHDKLQVMPYAAKEYIEQLRKENLDLKRILAERDKLIELTGIELQKLRIHLQKVQQQNLLLAQSNSQILHELNLGKDRLKALQHELGCKNGMLKAKDLEMKEHVKEKACEIFGDEVKQTDFKATKVSPEGGTDNGKNGNIRRGRQPKSLSSNGRFQSSDEVQNNRPCTRRQSARFKHQEALPAEDCLVMVVVETSQLPPNDKDTPSEIFSNSACLTIENENIDAPKQETGNKRPCVRRQSCRFKSQELNPSEGFTGIDGCKILTATCLPSGGVEAELRSASAYSVQESRRSSINRPSRQASKKVQSYKEFQLMSKCAELNETWYVKMTLD